MSQNAQENRHSSSCDAHSRVKDVADDNSCCLTDCDWSDVFDVQLPDTLSVGDQIKNHLYEADFGNDEKEQYESLNAVIGLAETVRTMQDEPFAKQEAFSDIFKAYIKRIVLNFTYRNVENDPASFHIRAEHLPRLENVDAALRDFAQMINMSPEILSRDMSKGVNTILKVFLENINMTKLDQLTEFRQLLDNKLVPNSPTIIRSFELNLCDNLIRSREYGPALRILDRVHTNFPPTDEEDYKKYLAELSPIYRSISHMARGFFVARFMQ